MIGEPFAGFKMLCEASINNCASKIAAGPKGSEEALVTILSEPKNALVKQYQTLFSLENTNLTFTEDALKAIAKRAIARKTGARGLRSILEDILLNTMFELPGLENVQEVVVNVESVTGESEPLIVYSDNIKKASAS